jgi:hypothetical protein
MIRWEFINPFKVNKERVLNVVKSLNFLYPFYPCFLVVYRKSSFQSKLLNTLKAQKINIHPLII